MTTGPRMVEKHIVPLLEWYGVADALAGLARRAPNIDRIRICLDEFCDDNGLLIGAFSNRMIEELIADLRLAGKLTAPEIAEGSNVEGVERAPAPSGIGLAGGNVWVTPPGESYILWFLVNGELKLELTNYYITSLASIGAGSGDTVQVCRVVDGVVGWWTAAAVP